MVKKGDRVQVAEGRIFMDTTNGKTHEWQGTVTAGPKPTKRGMNYWDVLGEDGWTWSYPESRLTVVGGGDSVGEVPALDDEPMDMAYEREKDDALMDEGGL